MSALGLRLLLIVEDDPSLRRMIAAQLNSLGYVVVTSQNADAALEALEGNREIDLLFTDIVLSEGLNGVELGQVARERYPGLSCSRVGEQHSLRGGSPTASKAIQEMGHCRGHQKALKSG